MRKTFRSTLVAVLAMTFAGVTAGAQTTDSTVPRRRIQPLPAVASSPETGLQFGATVLAVFEPAAMTHTRASSIIASAVRSTKAQTRLVIEGERWTTGNARRFYGQLAWQEFPLPYYGSGDDTPASAKEIYAPRGIEMQLSAQQRLRGPLYAFIGTRLLSQRMRFDTAGTLRFGNVTGSAGGRVVELNGGALIDTREHLFAPRSGTYAQLTYTHSASALSSDYRFQRVKLDARRYQTVAGNHVLAAQLLAVGTGGAAPFDQLALVGGSDILRGYTRGRYRDRALAAAQLEYRSPIVHRVGAVAFGGAGTVAETLGDIGRSTLFPTYGAGVRVQIDPRQRTAVRADYGRGRDGASGLYIGFNQAF
jgi:hypothetical protein